MKKTAVIVLCAICLYLSLPFLYLFAPSGIRDYVYRELCYHTVMDKISRSSRDTDDMLKKTVNYIYRNIDSSGSPAAIDDNSWNCLVRGFGYCDQQAWALATLLAKIGVPSRLVMLARTRSNGHSVAEVYINGKWRLVDAHHDAVFYNRNGELATIEEIWRDPAIVAPVSKRTTSPDIYMSYFDKASPPERWDPLTKKQGLLKKAIFSPVYIEYKLFGRNYTDLYQYLYLLGSDEKTAARNRCLINDAG